MTANANKRQVTHDVAGPEPADSDMPRADDRSRERFSPAASSVAARQALVSSLSRGATVDKPVDPLSHAATSDESPIRAVDGAPDPSPRGWLVALVLCLAAWATAAFVATVLPGQMGWWLGGLALFAVPTAWLVWQLRQLPPDDTRAGLI